MKNKFFSRKKLIVFLILVTSLGLLSLFIFLFMSMYKNTTKSGRKCYKYQTFIVKQNLIYGALAVQKCSWYKRNCDNTEVVYLNSPDKTYERISKNGKIIYIENTSEVNYQKGQKVKATFGKCWVHTGTHKYLENNKQKAIPVLELMDK